MSGVTKKLMSASGGVAGFTAIEDVFSTYIFDGDNGGVTISNGIDLANEGGLVWNKDRTASYGQGHALIDTERGPNKILATELSNAETTTGNAITFNSDGYSCTAGVSSATGVFNASGFNIASWTFRKAPRFFDVVTYTGDGVAGRQIAHGLDATVGTLIIRRTDSTQNWFVWHRAYANNQWLVLNETYDLATTGTTGELNNTTPTDSVFTVGSGAITNASGGTYVAYLYAHDPLGPSGDGSDGLIDCGGYTGNGSATGPVVNLGWEPQWLLVKRSNSTGDWNLIDNMRGFTVGGADAELNPNLSAAESTGTFVSPTSTGFQLNTTDAGYNASGGTYVYIAIRRGPMRTPTSGTEVFATQATRGATDGTASSNAFTSGFPIDLLLVGGKTAGAGHLAVDRLRGNRFLRTQTTDAEVAWIAAFDDMDGLYFTATLGATPDSCGWMFRRAPEFFDVVAYTGDGVAGRTVSHNLGVAPEMMIVKARSEAGLSWVTYHSAIGATHVLTLNTANQANPNSGVWNNTAPTDSVFSLSTNLSANKSGTTYIAYLFATLAGVSKVGSYTGNGTSQTINCGFTTGARFILIKRTDSTGDWYVWDTARGIVAANDPHLSLNTTAAEVTTDDSVDPVSSGFIVNQVAATNINVSAASYIFYAVA